MSVPDKAAQIVVKTKLDRWFLLDLAALALLAAFLALPVLLYGVPDLSNDGVEHARWAKNFSSQVWAGDLYPRWLYKVNAGLGAPTFYFYPPFSSYISAIFWPAFSQIDNFGWRTAGITAYVGLALSGMAVYCWLVGIVGRGGALFAGVVYAMLPYHVAIDLYNRGAIAEFWSFVWLPLILLSVERLINGSKWAFIGLTLSFTSLLFTHLLITMLFTPIPIAAALFLSAPGRRIRPTLLVCVSMGFSFAIASVFYLPAILDQPSSYMYLARAGEDYHDWWLFKRVPLLDMRMRILILTLLSSGFALVLGAICWRSRPQQSIRKRLVLYSGIAIVTFFCMTQVSAPLWAVFSPLRWVQFPVRFNTVLCVAIAGIAGLAFRPLIQQRSKIALALVIVIMSGWMGANIWAASKAYTRWREIPANTAARYPKRIALVDEFGAMCSKWEPQHLIQDILKLEAFVAAHPPQSVHLEGGAAYVTAWKPRQVQLRISTDNPGTLTLNHFFFPGWQAQITSAADLLPVRPSPEGLLQIDLPAGHYDLVMNLERDGAEKAGAAIAASALILLAITAIRYPNALQLQIPSEGEPHS